MALTLDNKRIAAIWSISKPIRFQTYTKMT